MPVNSRLTPVDIPNDDTPFHRMFFDQCKVFSGDQLALINGDTNEQFTYKDIATKAKYIASSLLTLGLEKGEVVLLCIPNCPDFVWLFLGISMAGGVVSGLHPKFSIEEMRRQIQDSGARIAFVTPLSIDNVASVLDEEERPYRIICVGSREDSHGYPIMDDLSFSGPLCHTNFPTFDASIDLVYLPYSSGTTGKRKGCMITHRAYNAMISIFNHPTYVKPKSGERTIGQLHFYNQLGNESLFASLINGAVVVTLARFNGTKFIEALDKYKVQTQYMCPLLLHSLATHKNRLEHLRNIIVGMAAVSESLIERVLDIYPNIDNFIQVYGMTETGIICRTTRISSSPPPQSRCCGHVCANLSIKVIDFFTGEELGPNERGLLLVRGETVTSGYWNNPIATDDVFRKGDGWRNTGDIGYYDDEEQFFIVDRIKELIKVYGFQVSPAELEDMLLKHTCVCEAAVVAISDSDSGQRPLAYVVLRPDMKASADDIRQFVNAHLIKYKQIQDVIIATRLPRTASGKVLRRLLTEAASFYATQ